MTRRAIVTQADVKRVVAGARAAGLTVTGVRVDETGLTILTDARPADAALGPNAIKAALKKARERGAR